MSILRRRMIPSGPGVPDIHFGYIPKGLEVHYDSKYGVTLPSQSDRIDFSWKSVDDKFVIKGSNVSKVGLLYDTILYKEDFNLSTKDAGGIKLPMGLNDEWTLELLVNPSVFASDYPILKNESEEEIVEIRRRFAT